MELGAAAQTKRPTSVVLLLTPDEDSKVSGKYEGIKAKIEAVNPYL